MAYTRLVIHRAPLVYFATVAVDRKIAVVAVRISGIHVAEFRECGKALWVMLEWLVLDILFLFFFNPKIFYSSKSAHRRKQSIGVIVNHACAFSQIFDKWLVYHKLVSAAIYYYRGVSAAKPYDLLPFLYRCVVRAFNVKEYAFLICGTHIFLLGYIRVESNEIESELFNLSYYAFVIFVVVSRMYRLRKIAVLADTSKITRLVVELEFDPICDEPSDAEASL